MTTPVPPRVPFLDLHAAYNELKSDLDRAYREVMESGWYILGEQVSAFEAEFASYCETEHCVGVGNGLEALHLLLRALDVGPGDEVVVPGHTFIATWLAVTRSGARPVPVEPDPETLNLCPRAVAAAITARTRAILAVHLYGQPADMDALAAVAEEHGVVLLEDAAQAHGARYRGRRTGSLGRAAAWSFYPAKNLGAFGDGGAVTTGDAELARRLRLLRNYGSSRKYEFEVDGYNSRLDPLQAAFLAVRLQHLDAWNQRRRRIAERYLADLAEVPGLLLPTPPAWADAVWHLFVVRTARRNSLAAHLASAGIDTLIHYPQPPHLSGAYGAAGEAPWSLPLTERVADQVLSLPIGPHLADHQVARVIAAVGDWGRGGRTSGEEATA